MVCRVGITEYHVMLQVDELFEPLRGAVALLRKHGVSMPDATLEALDKAETHLQIGSFRGPLYAACLT